MGPETYRDCEKHGQYAARLVGKLHNGHELWEPRICPACAEDRKAEREREDQERLERDQQAQQLLRLQALKIPPRFVAKTFLKSFEENTAGRKQAADAARRVLWNPDNLPDVYTVVFSGGVGTGKTHLAIATLCELIRQNNTGIYIMQRQLIRELRATWDDGARETEAQALRRFINVDVLVVDEVGAGFGSEAERAQFFEVIDGRYSNASTTILVSNLDREALADYIGERAFDRLREDGLWVSFNWGSARGSKE